MRSIFLVFGAFAYASEECQLADEATMLQAGLRGRKAKRASSKDTLAELRKVASSLTERSAVKLGREEVDQALATARDALEAISPTIYGQVTQAQTQINDAGAAVQVCHAQSGINQRAELLTQVQTKQADLQTCQAELATLTQAAAAQCAIAQDCLCDEANVRRDDKETLCASKQELYELAFCEHNLACTTFGSCHEQEMSVYVALQNDVEAEMEVVTQEYITVQQSSCLMALIQSAIAAGQPIDSSAMLACNTVDTTAMTIVYPALPVEPSACPAAAVGNPACAGTHECTETTVGNDGTGNLNRGGPDGASNIQFIDLTTAFSAAGQMTSVRYYVSRASQAGQKFQVYRPVGGNTYRLVAETEALASPTANTVVTHQLATPLQYQTGDFIGWVHAGQGTFPFTGGGSVRWRYGTQGVGSDIAFDGAGSRIYGYEATVRLCNGPTGGGAGCNGGTTTVGNDGSGNLNRGGPDGASNIQFIDLSTQMAAAGEMTSVRYHVSRGGQAGQKFQVYRPVGGNTYNLVAETPALSSPNAGSVVTQQLATPLRYEAGDYIGWVHAGQGTFPFTGGGSVRWRYGTQGVGSNINFDGAGSRIYGYEATMSLC